MVRLSKIISLSLMYLLLLFGVIWFIFYGFNLPFISVIMLFFFGFLMYYLVDNLEINENYKIFIGLAIWLNALSYTYLYKIFLFGGYPVHFVDSILITFIIYDYLKKNLKVKEAYIVIFAVLTVVGIISSWEIYEYFTDMILRIHMQGIIFYGKFLVYPIDDTMWDIIIGCIGALLTFIVIRVISPPNLVKKLLRDKRELS